RRVTLVTAPRFRLTPLSPPQRPPPPAAQAAHRDLPVAGRVHARLMGAVEKPRTEVAAPASWDYAPSLEGREIVSLERRYGLYIGGKHISPKSRSWFTTISPATEEALAEIAQAGEKGGAGAR